MMKVPEGRQNYEEKEKLRSERERMCVSGRCQNQSNGCVGSVQMFLMTVTAVGTSRRTLGDGNSHFNIIIITLAALRLSDDSSPQCFLVHSAPLRNYSIVRRRSSM